MSRDGRRSRFPEVGRVDPSASVGAGVADGHSSPLGSRGTWRGAPLSSTRSKDRELIATTAGLVEFLRDVALARRTRVADVSGYDAVLWLDDLPAEVAVHTEAGPGETLFAIPRLRAEAPPEPPAALTNWLDKAALADSTGPAPIL